MDVTDIRLARLVNLLPTARGVDLVLTDEVYRDLSCLDGLHAVNRVTMNLRGMRK